MPNYLDMDDSLTPGLKGVKLSNGTKYELTYKTLKNKPCFRKDSLAEVYLEETVIPAAPSWDPYLTFSSNASFTLGTKYGFNNDGTLEYSTNLENWNEWDGTAIQSINNVIYLRGIENTTFQWDDEGNPVNFEINASENQGVRCLGNIENLLDYATVERGEHPQMGNRCFYRMFEDCSALTAAPELPSTTLTDDCYDAMFSGCTSLTTPPELPATTLAYYCYNSMFYGCTSLTTLPALPATTLADYCYGLMFYGCTSICISETQTGVYTEPYSIPSSGIGVSGSDSLENMFENTGGTFTGTPALNTTYYLAVN